MQPQPAVITSQSYVVGNGSSRLTVGVSSAKGLGLTQILIGSLTILFGILAVALLNYWAGYVGFAIWGGIWIVIGGILGVYSAANTSSAALNWTNMAFAIVSTCIMFIDFIIYCIAVGQMRNYSYKCTYSHYYYRYNNCYYTTNSTGVGIFSCLLALSIVEFAIALAVAICCCRYGCSGCCYGETRGVVVQQPQMVQGGYPATSYPATSYPATSYPVASYPVASYSLTSNHPVVGSSAPPPYTAQQQGAYTSAGTAAPTQPMAMTYNPNVPQEKQFVPPAQQ